MSGALNRQAGGYHRRAGGLTVPKCAGALETVPSERLPLPLPFPFLLPQLLQDKDQILAWPWWRVQEACFLEVGEGKWAHPFSEYTFTNLMKNSHQ
jgi:hypothetical protein